MGRDRSFHVLPRLPVQQRNAMNTGDMPLPLEPQQQIPQYSASIRTRSGGADLARYILDQPALRSRSRHLRLYLQHGLWRQPRSGGHSQSVSQERRNSSRCRRSTFTNRGCQNQTEQPAQGESGTSHNGLRNDPNLRANTQAQDAPGPQDD